MNNLVTMTNGEATVTSRQVAENFGKEHKSVLRAINGILTSEHNCADLFRDSVGEDSYGRSQDEFIMNRDGFTLLAMGFTGKSALTWKLKYIAAFNAMEKQLSTHAIPQTRAEALRLAADAMEQLDSAKNLIEIMEPKAKAFDIFIDSKGYYSVGTVAKMLGTGRTRLFECLRELSIIMPNNEPYQTYVNRGYFTVKGTAEMCWVSAKGVQWLTKLISG